MLRNYLLIAFRNLWHNKVYALINILGLAIGLTASLFIFQYVQFERSYDSFHENGNNIYRYLLQATINEVEESPQFNAFSNFAPLVKQECPEVVEYARLHRDQNRINTVISYRADESALSREFLEPKVFYAEASFMQMFSFPMLLGDAKALEEPNTLLLSEHMAEKLFGQGWRTDTPIGELLTINGQDQFMVRGVFEDIPENSHIKFEALLSLVSLREALQYDTELRFNYPTYLQLMPGTNIPELEKKLWKLADERYGEFNKFINVNSFSNYLQPLSKVHLHSSGIKKESEPRGSATTVQFVFIAGCFILILAWINYVNLSTARAVKRAKEVGIRKVVGAGRRQLITQFLLEALLINLLSLIVALTLYQIFLPFFTNVVQKEIPAGYLFQQSELLIGIGLVLVFGTLLSGGYSAFVLSSFKAVSTLKGKFQSSSGGVLLRRSLIVLQFVVSVGLIIGTFSVFQQLQFMQSQDMGYSMSQKLIVRAPRILDEPRIPRFESFKSSLKDFSAISKVTVSGISPGDRRGNGDRFVASEKSPEEIAVFSVNVVDEDYLATYDVELLHGRGFSREFPADSSAAVITEDVALQLRFDPVETALQQKLNIHSFEPIIIGIAKSINLYAFKLESTGVIFVQGEQANLKYQYFTLELDNLSRLPENLSKVEEIYKQHFPGNPFEYFFLDDYFNAQYRAEEQFGKVFTAASGLAIFIACLGLFGLSAFMIKQRTKEIGIRKVLGAPVQTILLLLSRDYFKLILLAGVIALPVAYFSLHRWLESYTVRIPLSWWLFLTPLAIVVLIALVTVSVQTIKAALANPAKSLRYE